jgi:hypothetical protein
VLIVTEDRVPRVDLQYSTVSHPATQRENTISYLPMIPSPRQLAESKAGATREPRRWRRLRRLRRRNPLGATRMTACIIRGRGALKCEAPFGMTPGYLPDLPDPYAQGPVVPEQGPVGPKTKSRVRRARSDVYFKASALLKEEQALTECGQRATAAPQN